MFSGVVLSASGFSPSTCHAPPSSLSEIPPKEREELMFQSLILPAFFLHMARRKTGIPDPWDHISSFSK